MMKRVLFIFSFLIFSLIIGINAQEIPGNIPGKDLIDKIDIDDSGQIKQVTEFQEKAKEFRSQNNTYLWKRWWVIMENNPVIGPFLYFTENFFAFFNPVWNFVFGLPFTWSLAFFTSVGIWITLIIIIYFPVMAFFNEERLMGLIAAIIIASLAGSTGIIRSTVTQLGVIFTNIWIFYLSVAITVIVIAFYITFFKGVEKESDEEKLEKAKENIKTLGETSEKLLKEFGGRNKN